MGRVADLIPIATGGCWSHRYLLPRRRSNHGRRSGNNPVSGVTMQLCGDAHASNFGLFGTPERRMLFDINDFDMTLPAPWEWDVKRLAVPGHKVGDSRLVGGRPPSAVCRRRVL